MGDKKELGILSIESGKIMFAIKPQSDGTIQITWNGQEFTEEEFNDIYERYRKSNPPRSALFDEVKGALRQRLYNIYKHTNSDFLMPVLGSLYLELKKQVVAEVANEKYPEKDIDLSFRGERRIWFLKKEEGIWIAVWNRENEAEYMGQPKLNNRQAAENFLALMQTPLFEGDVTI